MNLESILAPIQKLILSPDDSLAAREATQAIGGSFERGEELSWILEQARGLEGFNAEHLGNIVTPGIVARAVAKGQFLNGMFGRIRQVEGFNVVNEAVTRGQLLNGILRQARQVEGFTAGHLDQIVTPAIVLAAVENEQSLASILEQARLVQGFNAGDLGKIVTPEIVAQAVAKGGQERMGQGLDWILMQARLVQGFNAGDLDKIVTPEIVAQAVAKGQGLNGILKQAHLIRGFNAEHLDRIVTPEIVAKAAAKQELNGIIKQARRVEGMNDAFWTHALGIDPVSETLIDVSGASGGRREDAAGKRANFRRPQGVAGPRDHRFGNPNDVHVRSERMPREQTVLA